MSESWVVAIRSFAVASLASPWVTASTAAGSFSASASRSAVVIIRARTKVWAIAVADRGSRSSRATSPTDWPGPV